jgi:hypothetical protein
MTVSPSTERRRSVAEVRHSTARIQDGPAIRCNRQFNSRCYKYKKLARREWWDFQTISTLLKK